MTRQNKFGSRELAELVSPAVRAAGLFLEQARIVRSGRYLTARITVDLESGPGGPDSRQLEELTREISAILDDADPFADAYSLEVTTPGAARVLTEPRHYTRAVGRSVRFSLRGGESFTGRILQANDGGVLVRPEEKVKKSNKTIFFDPRVITFQEIEKARVEVELRKSDKSEAEAEG